MSNQPPVDLLRPELTSINRLPMRAPLAYYADAGAALADARPRRRRSLDGEWDLEIGGATHPVAVPGCWTMQGVGDLPHYTNIIMPWPGLEAPETPADNPVGRYRRSFEVPAAWLRDDVVLHLGGFESVAAVWCNDEFVGMGKDSRLASEFLLNDVVVVGENRLEVMVIRYSDATWIEDQDHWWHAGLHRSVFVEARPRDRVDDVACDADFDPCTGQGLLRVDAHVCGRVAGSVRVSVFDGEKLVGEGDAAVPDVPDGPPLQQLVSVYEYPGRVASIDLTVDGAAAWTAETPNLCTVVVELLDVDGRVRSVNRTRVGFRRVEVRDRRFLVNGVPIVFHGVNRHDHHHETGKVLSEADLRADLETMRRHNINAVRCAHYPNDPRLLDLCDELGMWVIDEANVESHGRLRSLADDPRYLPAILDRVQRMVVRDRNHPSVVMWSLGNEAGHGSSHDAAAAWVRAVDPSRPLHYEGAVQRRFRVEKRDASAATVAPSRRERAVTDVVCPMYTAVEVVEEWAEWAEATGEDDRPLVLCEFSHAMGNSNGGFDRYAEAFHRHPALAGGFVWDWRDQGLAQFADNGREFWAYGGHFGDEPNDANFCMNGLVASDGEPHPGLAQVAWGYQPVRVTSMRGRRVRVENRRAFRDLSDLDGHWMLVMDGDVVESGTLDVPVAPGQSATVDVPFTMRLPRAGDVQLRVCWCDADGEMRAVDEVVLRVPSEPDLAVLDDRRLRSVRPSSDGALVRVGDTSVAIGSRGPEQIVLGGRPVMSAGLEPCLWRAPTDNDGVAQGWMSEVAGARPGWIAQGLDQLTWAVTGTQVLRDDDVALVVIDRQVDGTVAGAQWTTKLVLSPDGVTVDEAVVIPDAWTDVPRVGTRFEVDPSFDRLRWFGLGPHETYADRLASAWIGVWDSTVADQYHPYAVPQEHGAHHGTRWFELVDTAGAGFRFDGAAPFSFNARLHHDAALSAARTLAELDAADSIEVHIDAAQRGLGTGACGPDTPREYRIGPGEYRWRFTITEVTP